MTAPVDPTRRRGRADLHVHTLASDGTSSVQQILDHVEGQGFLDVIAIADHERVDAALAASAMARDQGLRLQVVVGEEISTRGGHLLALWIERQIPSLKPMRWTIEAIHDQGGVAIPAHPFVPHPMCAQGSALRRLLDEGSPVGRPDAIETFNPTAFGKAGHAKATRFAAETGLGQLGNSDAHIASAIGTCWSSFEGRTADDVRAAILAGATLHHGDFHGSFEQVGVYGRQLRKYAAGWKATVGGRLRRDGTGRDLGYPGGRLRPARYDPSVGTEDRDA
jgi:predicted metal-dependent phosphoesterase TrpH